MLQDMNWFTYCRNKKCSINNECKRFTTDDKLPDENVINFSHMCNEKNGYYLRIEKEKSELVVKEEGENK
ncbi:MAG: hypothetical protein A2086_15325 [Spirochaetes bacterium GWD1_27_9]|nr:MAG: hypothetical protein A2Y34_04500 [Spirochaetes bacterium GWC1_27_15]OHD32390.1 MAG: hypothetical protein A2086_15325 [Spirochaetes bacterium GWD1_27_9]